MENNGKKLDTQELESLSGGFKPEELDREEYWQWEGLRNTLTLAWKTNDKELEEEIREKIRNLEAKLKEKYG